MSRRRHQCPSDPCPICEKRIEEIEWWRGVPDDDDREPYRDWNYPREWTEQ